MIGVDTAYSNSYSSIELVEIAKKENRIILSRNTSQQKNKEVISFTVKSEDAFQQLKEVDDHFNLKEQMHAFSRCMVCNGILEPVAKENILERLKQDTIRYFKAFWECSQCHRIYWKGSHYNKMQATIEKLLS